MIMEKGAIISEDEIYRFRLWRIWNKELPLVLFVMLNPSKADATINDHTITKCIGFSSRWGYGGFYVGNLFAWRDTDPEALYFHEQHGNDVIGVENDTHIKEMATLCKDVVFAWGNDGGLKGRNSDLEEMFPNALCLGRTKATHYKHPLMLAYTTPLINIQQP